MSSEEQSGAPLAGSYPATDRLTHQYGASAALDVFLLGHDPDGADTNRPADELQRRDNLDRRLADQKLVDALGIDGFAGPRYEQFQNNLIAYGIAILKNWMFSGHIFEMTARRGFPLTPAADELDELERDSHLRDELANMTAALAIIRFREDALVNGGWRMDGGASLTTWFLGTCLGIFPNEFRRHRAARARWKRAERVEAIHLQPAADGDHDPDVLVVGNLGVCDDIEELDPQTAAVVALTVDGRSQDEIAELLDLSSTRVVEGILYRWRTKQRRRIAGVCGGDT